MWVLAHGWEYPDYPECESPPPAPDMAIDNVEQLRTALWAKAAAGPYYFTLRSSVDDQFSLWLGGPWGGMSRTWRTGRGRSYRAPLPDAVLAPAEVWFETGGEGCYLPPDQLLPVAEVIEAAVYFFEHGELSPRVQWSGWDA